MLNNNVFLIGRLTKDVEVRKTPQGVSVTAFDLAVDRGVKVDNEPVTDFIRIQAWRHSADYLGKYSSKGDWVAVNGKIQNRSYENKQGQKVYVTEIVADSVKAWTKQNIQQPVQEAQPQHTQQTLNNGYDMLGYKDSSTQIEISSDELPFY